MNRLGNETSLYLRQHADNPVDWHPWDDRALQEARERECPILLSIGYSACHWCHVMAHESFEDEATARLMNELFVNIKVDREERPDLDRVFQTAHQMLTGRGGGWPLTVFLDPVDQAPFFAGTYFPLQRRYGMPAFTQVLRALSEWFRDNREEVARQNEQLRAALERLAPPPAGEDTSALEQAGDILQRGAAQLRSRHDGVNGGYGGAPKFPQAPVLEAVAALGDVEDGFSLHGGLQLSRRKMAAGGLRDHLDGGFFRYCVDGDWTIPHFEKMLYDNAMLLPLYAEGAARWDDPGFADTASGIVGWLTSVMRQPTGAYAASLDADADGEEGGFHVWSREEVDAVLGNELVEVFVPAYGLDQPPNFEGRSWHLQRHGNDEQLSRALDLPAATVGIRLAEARDTLRQRREQRVHPAMDRKQLTSWNALLAAGLTRAALALDRPEWRDLAGEILQFIRSELWTGDRLLAVHNAGTSRLPAYLDDYAWLLEALLLHLQADWSRERLEFAIAVADALLERFGDAAGGFYFSDAAVEVPLGRRMIFHDDATPNGNAGAIRALNRLGRLLGSTRYTDAADRCLERAALLLKESPMGHCSLLVALLEATHPPAHLVIGGTDPVRQDRLKQWARSHYQVDCYQIGSADPTLPGILGEYRSDEPLTAWLCRGLHCEAPARSRRELESRLGDLDRT